MSLRKLITLVLLLVGVWQTSSGMYIPAKAWLAQQLIHRAWTSSLTGNETNKPWSWADTAPVARLVAPEHNEDLIVLSGASGEALAFGPGHVAGSDMPGGEGHVIVGGHRDTHFRFLQHAKIGQTLQLHSRDGLIHDYEIDSISIQDITQQPLILEERDSLLTLITCYPFTGLAADKNQRYVVTAKRR